MRKIFIAVGIIVVLSLGALVAVPYLFRDTLKAKVQEALNRQLEAKVSFGSVGLSLIRDFPQLSFCLGDLTLVGTGPFEGDTLLYAEEFRLALSLFDVLGGKQIGIRSVRVHRPYVQLKILADGRANYDILKTDTVDAAQEPSEYRVSLQSYRLSEGRIVYDDASTRTYIRLDGVSHSGRGDFTQSVFDLTTQSDVSGLTFRYDGVSYLNQVRLNAEATFRIHLDSSLYTLKKNEFVLNELPLSLDGWVALPEQDVVMDLRWALGRSDFRSLLSLVPGLYSKDFRHIKAEGKVAASGRVWGTYGVDRMPAFEVSLKVENGQFQYPQLPQAVHNVHIDLNINNSNGQPDQTEIDLKQLHAELGSDVVDARLNVKTPVSDPNVNGMIKGMLNLGNLKNVIPLPEGTDLSGIVRSDVMLKGRYSAIEQKRYEQFEASGRIKVENLSYQAAGMPALSIPALDLEFHPHQVALQRLQVRSGTSDFSASGYVDNLLGYYFRDELLKGSFQLTSQLIDLNEFMTGTATTTQPPDSAAMEVLPVPANINFQVQMEAGRLLYEKLELRNVKGILSVRDQMLELQQLSFSTLGGTVRMSGSYNTKNPSEPQISYSLNINNIDIQQAVAAVNSVGQLAPIAQRATGRVGGELAVHGKLDKHMQPILMSLSGHGLISGDQISVSNFEPLQQLAEALKMTAYHQLNLPQVRLSFRMENGRVHVSPFETSWHGAKSVISGSHGLDQSLDYLVQLSIPRSQLPPAAVQVFSAGLAKVQQMAGASVSLPDPVQVNIKVRGTVAKPIITTDFRQQATQAAETMVQAAEQKAQEKIQEVKADLRAEADRILKQAQQQAQLIRQQAQQAADKIKKEGYAQADKLVAEAKNPIAKAAAQEAAKKLKQETDKKAQAVLDAAEKEAQKVLQEAQKKADELLK
ncbi:MAG: hypothetical protein NZL95_01205 [Chitinophagales bacterium]|nr:hypothetical protein [Chitinophagales bacterium]MDW8427154.1 AsmA-like C-terminal region-containing protein [Chitinophagales bacterium]